MNIVVDARILSYDRSGIARYTSELLQGLSRSSIAEQLKILRSIRPTYLALPQHTRQHYCITPAHFPYESYTLPLEIRAARPTLVHACDFFCPVPKSTPLILTIHDLYFLSHPEVMSPTSFRHYSLISRYLSSAAHIICDSKHTRDDLLTHFPDCRTRCSVIYPGVDYTYWSTSSQETPRDCLLAVGTIEPRKNLIRLIAAYAEARQEIGSKMPPLYLVGREGSATSEVRKKIATFSLEQNVVLLGSVSDDKLRSLYHRAICLCYTSSYEGFGFPALEAMAAGAAVLSSLGSSVEEIAKGAAKLVDANSISAIARALIDLLNFPKERDTLIAAGALRVKEFSWDSTAAQVQALYQEVVPQLKRG